MKKCKVLIIAILASGLLTFNSCTDWLNVQPKDQMITDQIFATELAANSVLNGIYRRMTQNQSYGQALTQTVTEYMGRFYWFAPSNFDTQPDLSHWAQVAVFNYDNEGVHNRFQSIWNHTFETILRINVFIEELSAREDVMREARRDILLGEAYALRAFLHFDMYRLFGPINITDEHPGLRYNRGTIPEGLVNLSPAEFIEKVLEDLQTALELLENDPVRTYGINDILPAGGTITSEDIFAQFFRNRRMNFFAASALEARVLSHVGRHVEAAAAARAVLEGIQEQEGNNRFRWVPAITEANRSGIIATHNFIFYNEVLFGLDNLSLHENWTTLFDRTRAQDSHIVPLQLLRTVFGAEGALHEVRDIRVQQWRVSNVNPGATTGLAVIPDGHRSIKFRRSDVIDEFRNFQPLMRISELYYIQAEAALARGLPAEAVQILQSILRRRGWIDVQLETINTANIREQLKFEMYREFSGEGQVFFFLKRNDLNRIFNREGSLETILDTDVFVVPLPDSETKI